MPLKIVRNDITKMKVDAIVNAANQSLAGGGGVDGCIHRAAGPALLSECIKLGGCETGSAKITGAGRLQAKYVIHAVGPRYQGGKYHEREKLQSCYRTALALAAENNCESVAFPLISAGIYGYPKGEALQIAVSEISSFLMDHDMLVYLVIFDKKAFRISEKLFSDIESFIDDVYVDEALDNEYEQERNFMRSMRYSMKDEILQAPEISEASMSMDLDEAVNMIDESFSEMLLRKIDERGMTDAQCYHKANIDRKLFSKIRKDPHYKPSKPTAIAFAVALELSIEDTDELLLKAGFALSHSNKFDIIIEFFIRRGNYDIFEINEALFAFDQPLLGA